MPMEKNLNLLQIIGKKSSIVPEMAENPVFQRITLLTGSRAAEILRNSRAIVVGLGGVGSWCAEALVRSGIGGISLVDSDTVCASNINRQIEAASSTVGRLKTAALEERLKDINPSCEIRSFPLFFTGETAAQIDIPGADYVIDAIDSINSKLDLIETALASGITLFSSMGMAQKLDPTLVRTADVWETRVCPLARLVRAGLRKRNISGHFTAVYSQESSKQSCVAEPEHSRSAGLGSVVTVTATAGMVLASLVIKDVCLR